MWLVLCEDRDEAAFWAYRGLARRTTEPVVLVTAGDLRSATGWCHRVGDAGAGVEIDLADGRRISSGSVTGVLNRLLSSWNPSIELAVAGDRDYAMQEMHALFTSWLYALPGPALNAACSNGLSGAWRHRSEWNLLADRAGLATRPCSLGDPDTSPWDQITSPGAVGVVVVGEAVIDAVPGGNPAGSTCTQEACRRLAAAASTPLLGISFRCDPDGWYFAGATPYPDLRAGGESLIDAVAEHFGGNVRAA